MENWVSSGLKNSEDEDKTLKQWELMIKANQLQKLNERFFILKNIYQST